jgi:hypothetical protein
VNNISHECFICHKYSIKHSNGDLELDSQGGAGQAHVDKVSMVLFLRSREILTLSLNRKKVRQHGDLHVAVSITLYSCLSM